MEPNTVIILFSLFFGLIFGSFLNVCIYRIPLKKSIIFPPSSCPECGHRIRFYDNIPVLSYLLLRAKCRYCHARIPMHYPVVELLTGLLSMALFIKYGLSYQYILSFLFIITLVLISFIDLHHQIIPDILSLPGIFAGIAVSFIPGGGRLAGLPHRRGRRWWNPLPHRAGIPKGDRKRRNGGRRCETPGHDRRLDGMAGPSLHRPPLVSLGNRDWWWCAHDGGKRVPRADPLRTISVSWRDHLLFFRATNPCMVFSPFSVTVQENRREQCV